MRCLDADRKLTFRARSSTSQVQIHWRLYCLPSKPDFASSDGTQVCRLKEVELKGLRKRLKEADDDRILDSSRVIMGDETEAHTLSGNSILINGKLQQVGFSVDLLPRIHKATINLTIVVVHSQPVTNQPN